MLFLDAKETYTVYIYALKPEFIFLSKICKFGAYWLRDNKTQQILLPMVLNLYNYKD